MGLLTCSPARCTPASLFGAYLIARKVMLNARSTECLGGSVKNEIRYVEVAIALAEDKTLHSVLPACQGKQLLGVEIVEYNAELFDLRSRKDALSGK
jgi:hypothetical protein